MVAAHRGGDQSGVAAELLETIVRAGGSRQVVATAAVALFRAVTCTASDMTLQEHEEIASIAAKHLGEGTGIARLCTEVKARGQPLLAKQLSQQHRARNQQAHPRASALSLADRLDKVLEVPGPVPPPGMFPQSRRQWQRRRLRRSLLSIPLLRP